MTTGTSRPMPVLRSTLLLVVVSCALVLVSAGGAAQAAVTRFALPANARAASMTFGPDGNLWLADPSGAILHMCHTGEVTRFQTGLTGYPLLICGTRWEPVVHGAGPGRPSPLGRITPAGEISEYLRPSESYARTLTR